VSFHLNSQRLADSIGLTAVGVWSPGLGSSSSLLWMFSLSRPLTSLLIALKPCPFARTYEQFGNNWKHFYEYFLLGNLMNVLTDQLQVSLTSIVVRRRRTLVSTCLRSLIRQIFVKEKKKLGKKVVNMTFMSHT
jgi:VanZ family protein